MAVLLASGGGYVAYTRTRRVQAQKPPEPTIETATVTQGDIVITASGSRELIPTSELELSFRTSGVLDEVLVETGDQVEEDDVLARLETDGLERAVAEADVELQIAQLELADVREGPSEAELADAEARVRDAQTQLSLAYDVYQDATDDDSDDAVESAKVMYDWWVGYYQSQKAKYEEANLSQTKHDYAMAAMIEAEETWERAKNEAQINEIQAWNSVEQAQNAVFQAEDMQAWMEEQGIGAGGGFAGADGDPDARATRRAETGGEGIPSGENMPSAVATRMAEFEGMSEEEREAMRTTVQAGGGMRGGAGLGATGSAGIGGVGQARFLLRPLIEMLAERAG